MSERILAEVHSLALTDRDAARSVKEAAAEKTYRPGRGRWPDPVERPAAVASPEDDHRATLPGEGLHRRGRGTRRVKRILESSWRGEVDRRFVWRRASSRHVREGARERR
jgi:hypothetical protein